MCEGFHGLLMKHLRPSTERTPSSLIDSDRPPHCRRTPCDVARRRRREPSLHANRRPYSLTIPPYPTDSRNLFVEYNKNLNLTPSIDKNSFRNNSIEKNFKSDKRRFFEFTKQFSLRVYRLSQESVNFLLSLYNIPFLQSIKTYLKQKKKDGGLYPFSNYSIVHI